VDFNQKNEEKIFYSISEVAKRFDVNASLIRFWEKEFDIIKPQKNKKGNRLFTKQDVDNFYVIYNLVKERGFTLQGAKDKLKQNKESTVKTAEIIQSLNHVKEFLIELRKNL
jgi:DNA-binding transcriptional MerR regulator